MTPAEILAHLGAGVDVLTRPRFRGDPRHRSLAATIDWSYRLLPDDVATLLDRLGLLPGPFTAELACSLGADVGLDPPATAEALQLLVDSSLVAVESGVDGSRYRLFETVRAVAMHRLDEQGSVDDAHRRLADHVADAARRELTAAAGRRWGVAAFGRLLAMYDIIAASLRWCLANDDDGARSLTLCASLWGVVHLGHTDEIAAMAQETIRKWPDPTAPFAADAIATTATAMVLSGDAENALTLAERSLDSIDADSMAAVLLRRAMGISARALQDLPTSLQLFTDVAADARAKGMTALALEADVNRANLLAEAGDVAAGLQLAAEARDEAAANEAEVNRVWATSVHARLRMRQDVAAGLAEAAEALEAARRIAYPVAIGYNLRSVTRGLIAQGRHREAADTLSELLDIVVERGGVAELRGALSTTGELLHATGSDSWRPLAATAESLPHPGPTMGAVDCLIELPAHDAAPLRRRDAIILARSELRSYLAAEPDAGAIARPVGDVGTEARFVNGGDFWDVTFAGQTVRVRTSKGMADLGRLLSSPGREIHCLELIGAGVEQSSTGEVLDHEARRSYEQRIRDLQEDVDSAEADNDYARAERAQAELDSIVEHLSAALGLGGRSRRQGSTTERARSAVTQRIRSTVHRLGAVHPTLGRHLQVSVVTGTYCVYRPERPVNWHT
jgi:tetratricopeptide (TPR) repeat protein